MTIRSHSTGYIIHNELTFVRNRGELAEGWYDPATLHKAQASASTAASSKDIQRPSPDYDRGNASSDDDGPGPALPSRNNEAYKESQKSGPAIPSSQDLELQRGKSLVSPYSQSVVYRRLV